MEENSEPPSYDPELLGLLYYPDIPSEDPLLQDPVEIPVSEYKNIRPHQIDNFFEKYIPQITAHKGILKKITPITQYEDTYNRRDTYDLECICAGGHSYVCKPETLVTGMWCKKCADSKLSQNPVRNKYLSQKIKEYYATDEGKKKKRDSMVVRKATLDKIKAEIQSTITQKECGKCKKILPVSEFSKKSDARDGFQAYCKECKKMLNRKPSTEKI
jgi:hypothetical protein